MVNKNRIAAALFTLSGQTSIIVSLPSSSGNGMYLTGASLLNGQIVIGHECPASRTRKSCWHTEIAAQTLKDVFWWKRELDSAPVISINRKVKMSEEWRQIPIPQAGVNEDESTNRNEHTA
ncbi:hypothetical protein M2444_004643 [Paenibacillus sp. PastF-3]|uniref:hypothetical protein n=1 Tax=Paenibacillus sp. PastF-3 TaxID=2940626 RepID=UPI002475B02F|nr:hypothetical protein [Paenibacillus sp. PastF-3]MDH6372814.1 hypothetical protein [Paenibacillus sp. PastF-3]